MQVAVESAKGLGVPGGKARPSVLAFSRQGMPNQPGTSAEGVSKGAYVVHGGDGKPDLIVMATGVVFVTQEDRMAWCCNCLWGLLKSQNMDAALLVLTLHGFHSGHGVCRFGMLRSELLSGCVNMGNDCRL